MHRCTTLMCHCEEANGRRGNLAGHGWMTGYLRRNRNCLPEIATTPAGSRNDKSGSLTPMNLCLKYASLQGAQGTPLQTQSVCTFLSSICTNCECLPEIAPQGHFLALRAQGATSAVGLLAMTHQGGAVVHQSTSAVELPCTRRSLSAATDAIGACHCIDTQRESPVQRRARQAAHPQRAIDVPPVFRHQFPGIIPLTGAYI